MADQEEVAKTQFRDCARRFIQLHHYVATNQEGFTFCLRVAQVIGFTPKKVKIRFEDGTETTKFGNQLAIL